MPYPFGFLFPEEIRKGEKRSSPSKVPGKGEEGNYPGRLWFFWLLLIFVIGLLFSRLFVLTILEGGRYRKLAAENRIRETKIRAPRGIIYDREKVALVGNIPTFSLPDGRVFFEEKPATFSAEVSEGVARDYLFGELFAHLVGYTGEVSEEELSIKNREPKTKSLELGDIVGKMGVEESYDSLLRGRNGKELIEVDAWEKKVRTLGRIAPVAGENLRLTLFSRLQKVAQEALGSRKGAVVATIPTSGEVLVLYSFPSFDPNIFIRGGMVGKILEDEGKPLFNRAIAGLYPPGSTFKIVTALSGLETGAIDKETKFEDVGVLKVGRFSFANWYFSQYGKKEGLVDVVSAIKRSNDIFFYKAGEAVGIENLAKWGRQVGVGRILGLDIAGEAQGVMPDPLWQKKEKGENWYLGNTYHVAIGQGDLQVTPLQVNAWTNVIANGGRLCRPHLLTDISHLSDLCKDLKISREAISLIREGMRQACAPGGTGWPLFKFKIKNEKLKIDNVDFFETYESTASGQPVVEIPTACKTGTAEFGDPQGRTHAWFTVFAPVYNPQISITVLVEGGGEGSSVAGPIAKKILEEWFSR